MLLLENYEVSELVGLIEDAACVHRVSSAVFLIFNCGNIRLLQNNVPGGMDPQMDAFHDAVKLYKSNLQPTNRR